MNDAARNERLQCLTEESCEVGKAVQKIHRFGPAATNPEDEYKISNRELLEREVGDVLYVIEMLIHFGELRLENLCEAMRIKYRRIKKYAQHQPIEELPRPCAVLLANPPTEVHIPTSAIEDLLRSVQQMLEQQAPHLSVVVRPDVDTWLVCFETARNSSYEKEQYVFRGVRLDNAVRAAYHALKNKESIYRCGAPEIKYRKG